MVNYKNQLNFVHRNQIWSDHILAERTASKRWPETWGFLKGGGFKVLIEEEREKRRKEMEKKGRVGGIDVVKLPPIQNKVESKSTKSFPKTTSQEIGYRSTQHQCNLEIYGRYAPNAKGYGGLSKMLKWPPEGCC